MKQEIEVIHGQLDLILMETMDFAFDMNLINDYCQEIRHEIEKIESQYNVINCAYKDALLKKSKSMKQTATLYHSNETYVSGINTALDNFNVHIKELFVKHCS